MVDERSETCNFVWYTGVWEWMQEVAGLRFDGFPEGDLEGLDGIVRIGIDKESCLEMLEEDKGVEVVLYLHPYFDEVCADIDVCLETHYLFSDERRRQAFLDESNAGRHHPSVREEEGVEDPWVCTTDYVGNMNLKQEGVFKDGETGERITDKTMIMELIKRRGEKILLGKAHGVRQFLERQ